ncbi:molybdopterin-dependent oxidoreductase alpha subunit [Pseudomonas sp. BIGb0408]|uniref:Molybdopterin-dependent oxidoreductase alpha subunit n=1 Tax=Phytopseudomonas flavescens TaxID=29435 RepID=A0A7Y9XID8_9GAMM|nr:MULTISPECIES: FdhF/YdeP family oxidoreductase [Pseudomonas]MCW2293566.1 molybdopterin-dependent oxidoreductase alpha subunit [Pseudomonas sp. BIGb0408]NYH71863.1 molybdopterin-dependent oxidoreductase alpha subunit [Pseudomonas flavescens]
MLTDPKTRYRPYTDAAGGWGSAKSVARIVLREQAVVKIGAALLKQNKPSGFACVSCAWAKPGDTHPMEFCENGAKATAWELTAKRTGPEFFARHRVAELRNWSAYALEQHGRLTHPMRYDASTDRYEETSWEAAYQEIGATLRTMEPDEVVFYASGRASLEASFMYQLFARAYGTNNLPDSSNMCHESTSVGLQESIGVPVGTVTLNDFEHTDCLLFFGQNVGSNSPRMLHQLQEARQRDVPIITFNPLKERGLQRFVNPQSPGEMLGPNSTQISTQYHQVAIGGDTAAVTGVAKALLDLHDAALQRGEPGLLDDAFIATHTRGVEDFIGYVREQNWAELESITGLSRGAMEATALTYAQAQRVMIVYGMGLTQHRQGVQNVQMLVNLLLLRGNIGKPGAGICPVRGHSNVQGQRTVGIAEDPAKVPVDLIEQHFKFSVPEKVGLCTVDACSAMLDGRVRGFVSLGGNFIRAVPDTARMEPAWQRLKLNVQVATKLNHSHLLPGEQAWLLPCLGRIEADRQDGVEQSHSTEDSTGCIHGWHGSSAPASEHLRSEPAIIAGLALSTLSPQVAIDWDGWRRDYSLIRQAIATIYPEIFRDFNQRMWEPGGFHRPLGAAQREWATASGKAQFVTPRRLSVDDDVQAPYVRRDVLQLMTIRSNDQFNTTIYGYDDRFRGVYGTRSVIFMNTDDIVRLGLAAGDWVDVTTAVQPEIERRVGPLQILAYDIPQGCCAAYYPECNPLLPLWHHAERSKVPAAKSIPVTLRLSDAVAPGDTLPQHSAVIASQR